MLKITLLQKIYGTNSPEIFQETLDHLFKGLKVEAQVCGVFHGWLQVGISGEDQKFALNYLKETFGLCPEEIGKVTKFSTICGRIVYPKKSKTELYVDIGIFNPKPVNAILALQNLQSQLLDGRKLALEKIVELFGFTENFPLSIKICGVSPEKERISVVLSEQQISLFSKWIETFLDRLLIFGATFSDVKRAVKKSGFSRSIVKVESLGFLEQAIICKLGTYAVGLIPKIGHLLPEASFKVFSPRKISKLFASA